MQAVFDGFDIAEVVKKRGLSYALDRETEGWRIRFQLDPGGLQRLVAERFGRTVLATNRFDWSKAQVV